MSIFLLLLFSTLLQSVSAGCIELLNDPGLQCEQWVSKIGGTLTNSSSLVTSNLPGRFFLVQATNSSFPPPKYGLYYKALDVPNGTEWLTITMSIWTKFPLVGNQTFLRPWPINLEEAAYKWTEVEIVQPFQSEFYKFKLELLSPLPPDFWFALNSVRVQSCFATNADNSSSSGEYDEKILIISFISSLVLLLLLTALVFIGLRYVRKPAKYFPMLPIVSEPI